jgi:hypothetical protein
VYSRSPSESLVPPVDILNPSQQDRELQNTRNSPLSPLELALTKNFPVCSHSRAVSPLEPISNLLSPLKLTLASKAHHCPNLQQITPLESGANLLSPLEFTLTKNAPVSPLESTLTKRAVLKSHRVILLQKHPGGGSPVLNQSSRSRRTKAVVDFFTFLLRYLIASPTPQVAATTSRCHNPSFELTLRLEAPVTSHESPVTPSGGY